MSLHRGWFTRRRVIQNLLLAAASPSSVASASDGKQSAILVQHQFTQRNKKPWQTLPPTPTLPSSSRTDWVNINRARIFYAQFGGAGPQVLLLHGGLASSNYWGLQVLELADSFSVTVMDTRGHGRSPLLSREFSYKAFAEDAVGLLDHLQIPAVSIVGWSDGAITGLQLALTHPHRVTKLFAFGANSLVQGLKRDKTGLFSAFMERCKSEYKELSPSPEKWPQLVAGLRQMWRTEPNLTKQKLGTLNVPTAISDGEHDEIIPLEHTKKIANEIPRAQLAVQRGVSHFAMLQNPIQFNKTLLEFLSA
jgi:pimeloyl-ACP methyl ester carboxylesterase